MVQDGTSTGILPTGLRLPWPLEHQLCIPPTDSVWKSNGSWSNFLKCSTVAMTKFVISNFFAVSSTRFVDPSKTNTHTHTHHTCQNWDTGNHDSVPNVSKHVHICWKPLPKDAQQCLMKIIRSAKLQAPKLFFDTTKQYSQKWMIRGSWTAWARTHSLHLCPQQVLSVPLRRGCQSIIHGIFI